MLIAGVDEAGRGAVIGPIIVAGVLFVEKDLPRLVDLKVKDSKLLPAKKREYLAKKIKKLAWKYYMISLFPREIDHVVETGKRLYKLNRLEARAMARVINVVKPDLAFVDAADVLAKRFGQHVTEEVSIKVKIVSEHKADLKYPVVSAASILAKVKRDKAVSTLEKKYGKIGSGYPSDPKTIKFLQIHLERFGSYPDFVRKSWKTAKRIKRKVCSENKKLF
jgi:ribonuclease HII